MYFYVDESGHTGLNLFDENQPMLYYGVLSSKINLDAAAEARVRKIRNKLGVQRLHAAELGNGRLVTIIEDIEKLRKRYDLRFDISRVEKTDHAIISFFDQVFDQGMNPAVPWTSYWTPLRFILLVKLATIFDQKLLKKAWTARTCLNTNKANALLVEVCNELIPRVSQLPDARSREVITDALSWAAMNPGDIYYNAKDKSSLLQIAPNIIGFQSVMSGIARRLVKAKTGASKIVVDRQAQFNSAQEKLSDFYAENKNAPMVSGPGLPEIDFSGMPEIPISCLPGTDSVGLELVDIYLWVFKRYMEEKELAPELYSLIKGQLHRGSSNEISINGIIERWSPWLENLPEPSADGMNKATEIRRIDEERRLKALGRTLS